MLIIICLLYSIVSEAKFVNPILDTLEFKEAELINVVRIISEMSDMNIVVTPETKNTKVTLFLRNVSVKNAIETICKMNNLWYRRDSASNTYRVMTKEEYSEDIIIHRNEVTKIFTMNNLNVNLAADAIGNLYGERVKRSDSGTNFDAPGNSGGSSGNVPSGSGGGDENSLNEELSIDQISSLVTSGLSGNIISGRQLQILSVQKEPIYVSIVSEHNLVLVRTGDRESLKQIGSLIKDLDRPIPQVLLEMKILDVLIDDKFSSVFNFELNDIPAQGDSLQPIIFGNNGLSNEGTFIFEYMSDHLKANIELLQKNKRVNVLSTPMILASNNRPSKLFVGEQQVIVTGYTATAVVTDVGNNTAVTGGSVIPETSVKDIGNSIEITPFINAKDGIITLSIQQENSILRKGGGQISIVTSQGTIQTLAIDTINIAELEGTIIVKDNHTIAVGGLIRETVSDEVSEVPFFGKIPLLGRLFGSTIDNKQRSELILLITPRLLKNPEDGEFNKVEFSQDNRPLSVGQLSLQCTGLCR
jgi:general secretion pathway protein D